MEIENSFLNGTALSYYIQSPKYKSNLVLNLELEKKICRNAFKNQLGDRLPSRSSLQMNVGIFDEMPRLKTSEWRAARNLSKKKEDNIKLQLALKEFVQNPSRGAKDLGNPFKALVTCSGVQLMSADWLLEKLTEKIVGKKNTRTVLDAQIRDTGALMNQLKSSCPILGIRLVATGRLGKRKKGMAQQISRSIGRVPLASFKQKVDYSQGFVSTKLGVIGIKVWICYA